MIWRPQESRGRDLLDALLVLFGYGSGSAGSQSRGTLKLRYCKRPFARLFPSWKLPSPDPFALADGAGGPGGLGTGGAGGTRSGGLGGSGSGGAGGSGSGGVGGSLVHLVGGAGGSGWTGLVGGPGGRWQSGADSGTKRIRLSRNLPSKCFSPFVAQPRPKRWKRLRTGGDEASLIELALLPEKDGTSGSVTGFDRIGIG